MNAKRQPSGAGRFFLKQAILLVVTIFFVVFFTLPLIKDIKAALNPGELEANVNQSQQAVTGLQGKLEAVRAKMLMGAGDDEAQNKLKNEVEELKRQLATKEQENKNLKDQMALVQTMLEVMKTKSSLAALPAVDTGHQVAEFLTKVFGCVASVFSGAMFLFAWWKKRREPS